MEIEPPDNISLVLRVSLVVSHSQLYRCYFFCFILLKKFFLVEIFSILYHFKNFPLFSFYYINFFIFLKIRNYKKKIFLKKSSFTFIYILKIFIMNFSFIFNILIFLMINK